MANANVVTWAGRSIYNQRLTGAGTSPINVGWGISALTASAFSDVNLFQAANPSPEARTAGASTVLSSNQLTDTFQVVGTITALSAKAITEVGLFDTATSLSPMCTLSAAANSTVLSITVAANVAGFPAMPSSLNYYAQLQNEIVVVTGGQSAGAATLTITRGALGSTAVNAASGSFLTVGGDGGSYLANNTSSSETLSPLGANGGSCFTHADFAVINLNTSDSIQFTLKVQLS